MAGLVPATSCCSRTQVLCEQGRGEAGSGEGGVWFPLYTVLYPDTICASLGISGPCCHHCCLWGGSYSPTADRCLGLRPCTPSPSAGGPWGPVGRLAPSESCVSQSRSLQCSRWASVGYDGVSVWWSWPSPYAVLLGGSCRATGQGETALDS